MTYNYGSGEGANAERMGGLSVEEPERKQVLPNDPKDDGVRALRGEAPLGQGFDNEGKSGVVKETIYISSLPFGANEARIRALFNPFGRVHGVELHADWIRPTYEPYALVEMESEDIEGLVEALDGLKIGRTYIRVHKRTM